MWNSAVIFYGILLLLLLFSFLFMVFLWAPSSTGMVSTDSLYWKLTFWICLNFPHSPLWDQIPCLTLDLKGRLTSTAPSIVPFLAWIQHSSVVLMMCCSYNHLSIVVSDPVKYNLVSSSVCIATQCHPLFWKQENYLRLRMAPNYIFCSQCLETFCLYFLTVSNSEEM